MAMQTLWVVAAVVWTLVGVGLLAAMIYSFPLARDLRRFLERSNQTLARVNDRFDPVMDRVEKITEDAAYISESLRDDVDEIGDAVDQGSRSARRIARLAEHRAVELDALLEVAQEEAESTFVSTASILGGVKNIRERFFGGR